MSFSEACAEHDDNSSSMLLRDQHRLLRGCNEFNSAMHAKAIQLSPRDRLAYIGIITTTSLQVVDCHASQDHREK